MELVEGRDLRETLRLGPLGPADAADMLADLAEALHVIHERGIVHRDVKPANVLLEPAHLPTRTWNAKLADFGIARLIDDARITRTGLLVGTPGYLSPEQVSGARRPRPPTCTRSASSCSRRAPARPPFPGPAAEAASARLVRDPDIPESLGADWVALLRAMTAREPADRPSALDVAVAAAQLDRTAHDAAGVTAPTIAFADVAAAADHGRRRARGIRCPGDRRRRGIRAARPATARPRPRGCSRRPTARSSRRPSRRARSPSAAPAPASGSARTDGERRWVRPRSRSRCSRRSAWCVFTLLQSALSAPTTPRRPSRCRACPATSACTSSSSTRR